MTSFQFCSAFSTKSQTCSNQASIRSTNLSKEKSGKGQNHSSLNGAFVFSWSDKSCDILHIFGPEIRQLTLDDLFPTSLFCPVTNNDFCPFLLTTKTPFFDNFAIWSRILCLVSQGFMEAQMAELKNTGISKDSSDPRSQLFIASHSSSSSTVGTRIKT